jgi:hypothetical protein
MEMPAADTSMPFGMYGVATVLLTAVNRRHFSLCYVPGHQETAFRGPVSSWRVFQFRPRYPAIFGVG